MCYRVFRAHGKVKAKWSRFGRTWSPTVLSCICVGLHLLELVRHDLLNQVWFPAGEMFGICWCQAFFLAFMQASTCPLSLTTRTLKQFPVRCTFEWEHVHPTLQQMRPISRVGFSFVGP